MKLSFFGAARAVTGSCHCIDVNGMRILVDCGLQQGRDEIDNTVFPFEVDSIDAVIVTHAHIDHSGRLPLLAKRGYTGPIFCTRVTGELLSIMLRDSAHIQESDAEYANRKGRRAGRPLVEPLYTAADAETAISLIEPHEYGEEFFIDESVRVRFADAGHLIGSAFAEVFLTENGKETKIVFSGDIGNSDQPIICDPTYLKEADFVVMESTYGDREHEEVEFSHEHELAEVISDTFKRGGNLIIPSFAVGRTQEILYFIREIKEQGLCKECGDFPVYIDSPLASAATKIFSGELQRYLDKDALRFVGNGEDMFNFKGLRLCESVEESKLLNFDDNFKIIISASGMCDAGRVRHHLKHNLWRADSSVAFVGYQVEGSLGRRLLDGADKVKLFGEEIAVNAKIVNLPGLSSHAGKSDLIKWITSYSPKPREVFVVHGEESVTVGFAEELQSMGLRAHAPEYTEVFDTELMLIVKSGIKQEHNGKRDPSLSEPYARLVGLAEKLLIRTKQCKGLANKELNKLSAKIQSILDSWS